MNMHLFNQTKLNGGASKAVSVSFIHITEKDATVYNPLLKQLLSLFQSPKHVQALLFDGRWGKFSQGFNY